MYKFIRNRHFFTSDVLLLSFASYLSFVLRLEDFHLSDYWDGFALFTGLVLLVTPVIFSWVGIYSRYWGYASVEELLLLAVSVGGSAIVAGSLSLLLSWAFLDSQIIPRSIPFIFFLLALLVTSGPRLFVRLVMRYEWRQPENGAATMPVLVMGAGSAGAMMVRELRQNPQLGMKVVGFLDDDPFKRNKRIHGVPVLGGHNDMLSLVEKHGVRRVIIAMPTAPGKVIREIVSVCERAGVQTKIIPGIYELLDGKVSVNQLRNVEIEDLLRRKPVRTDVAAVSGLIRGKRVMVTGGGGSIGSELCRQVMHWEPSELIIVGHGENSVFTIQNELLKLHPSGNGVKPGCHIHAVIADIRFDDRIRGVFEKYRPQIVFHAAAHKHVPLMEYNPSEAITNNVLGTRNLVEASLAADVEHFVMISTDKAVNPTSIMGASKRTAELLVHQAAEMSGKPYLAVRFGNVLGSRGSVVLTFKQQIAAGGPVTVTHPEMRRYFMTIPEAVQLVLQAATIGKGGEVFMLDMGEPVKIVDLARDMIELSGLEVGRDIDIAFSGMRPGEKLYEELFVPGENYQRTFHEKIFIACNDSSVVPRQLNESIRKLDLAARQEDEESILRILSQLVPQLRHQRTGRREESVPKEGELAAVDSLRIKVVGG